MKHAKLLSMRTNRLNNTMTFTCLSGNDVITSQVSDHHPVVHDGVLFWNIMMQGNKRGGSSQSFNNGFGLIESEGDYMSRLRMVGTVIAEAVCRDPSINVISLCEGPIKPEHVTVLFNSLKKNRVMKRFITDEMFYKPSDLGQNWGLLMLTDKRCSVTKVCSADSTKYPKLANRFQLWKIEYNGQSKYVALAHFPFAGDEHKIDKKSLSVQGQEYCDLINTMMQRYQEESFVFCADFNFNPYLISQWRDRELDKISHNNSILLTEATGTHKPVIQAVTVDGILLSLREKQKYYTLKLFPDLGNSLKSEHRFFKQAMIKMRKSDNDVDNRARLQM